MFLFMVVTFYRRHSDSHSPNAFFVPKRSFLFLVRQPLFSLALHGKLRKLQNKSAASKQELAALVAFADAMNPLPWRSDARPMLSCAICLRLFVGKPYAPT